MSIIGNQFDIPNKLTLSLNGFWQICYTISGESENEIVHQHLIKIQNRM